MKKKKRLLPEGWNWVIWYPIAILKSLVDPERPKRSSFPYMRAGLLALAVPVWFLALSLNLFWLFVFGFTAWFIGWAVMKGGIILFRFPADQYIRVSMLVCFWVAVVRFPLVLLAMLQGG